MSDEKELHYAAFNRFEFHLTADDARCGSHSGRCDDDIAALRDVLYIKAQLAGLDVETVRAELAEHGWDAERLADHDENLGRVLWLACCDIRENLP